MIIIKLMGGMGNQLFQYATGRAVASRNNTELKMDITGFEDRSEIATPRNYVLTYFNVQENFASVEDIEKFKNILMSRASSIIQKFLKNILRIKKENYIIEPKFSFNPEVMEVGKNVYLEGYWQTEKYFKDVEDVISKEFTLKEEFSIEDKEITKEIKNADAVSLHIRRGDYVAHAATSKFHGICSLEYYANAIKYIVGKIENPIFYIFSDDIEWVKGNLKMEHPVQYVSDGILKDYEELMLLSYCKHNIIANSSFSWWGAWLNNNPGKIVVAPRRWFADASIDTSDIIPETWIRM